MWFLRRMRIPDVVTYSNGTKDLVPMSCVHYQYSLQAGMLLSSYLRLIFFLLMIDFTNIAFTCWSPFPCSQGQDGDQHSNHCV